MGDGAVRCCERLSSAAHWASKASACCCGATDCVGDDTVAQLLAPLNVALTFGGCSAVAFVTGGRSGLPKGLHTAWVSNWPVGGVEKGEDWSCAWGT